MSEFVDRYEMELRLAAARHYSARSMRARLADALRRRPWQSTGLVIIALATPAYAATQVWEPTLGSSERTRPTQTAGGVPPAQVQLLGVLRRAQGPGDRAADTVTALRFLTKGVRGVRVGAIRALDGATPATLIPVTQYDPSPEPTFGATAVDDGLCLFVPDTAAGRPDGGGFTCATTAQVENGRALLVVGRRVVLLVPDGVKSIDVRFASDRSPFSVAVSGNTAEFDAPADRPASAADFEQTWRDADGAVVRTVAPPGGQDLRPSTDRRPTPRVACNPRQTQEACDAAKSIPLEKP